MGGTAAAVIPINVERLAFHGYRVEGTKELACQFCVSNYDKEHKTQSKIAFVHNAQEAAISVHAQLVICAEHLRELADKAEELAPEPWDSGSDPLYQRGTGSAG